jgi:actin related protein 2/3 complex subunit 5
MSYIDELKQRREEAGKIVKTDPLKALQLILNEMPVREKKVFPDKKSAEDKATKEKLLHEARDVAAAGVIDTVVQVERAKLAAAIKGLGDDERDTLMKFVYRGFAEPEREKEYMYLLTIHDEICKCSNLGPVIRSLHTRLEV